MKKISNFVVAVITLLAPIFSLNSVALAADKGIQINSNIEARVVFGDHIEGVDELIGTEFMVDNTGAAGSVDEDLLVYVSVEPDFFADVKLTGVTINGMAQDVTSPFGRNIYALPEANNYTIDIAGAPAVAYNINWSNPGYTDPHTPEDVKIKNGTAKVVKVYDNANDMNDISNTFACVATGCVDEATKEGFIHFEKGNVIVFEFVPQYGYQLTGVNMNGLPLNPQADVNQYILDTADANGNGHFSATFTRVNDTVKSNSGAVSGGDLDLSGGVINAGTGQLSVVDFMPSAEQVAGFEGVAAEYEIADYLDLSMQQIFYKGANDDTDVWSNDLADLAADANISLELAEGVNGNDVVIVHEKHDGTYELIDGAYDAASRTVSFATDEFSNYAIAYRTVAGSPDTGAATAQGSDVSDETVVMTIMTLGAVALYYVVLRKKTFKN